VILCAAKMKIRSVLRENGDTETFGRGGFFIHGGTCAGSAGCINLGLLDPPTSMKRAG